MSGKTIEQMSEAELAHLTDEEFMQLGDPELTLDTNPEYSGDLVEAPEAEMTSETVGDAESVDSVDDETAASGEEEVEEGDEGEGEGGPDDGAADPAGGSADAGNPLLDQAGDDAGKLTGDNADEEGKTEKTDNKDDADKGEDFKGLYEQIMAPFRANKTDITPRNVDEVRQLMQMGANYTKKMQGLAPHLKLVKMLEQNNLLDPGKLSFLIDIDKRDPAAIQKLVKDSGLDPLDFDNSKEPAYVPKDRQVSDEEYAFTSTLEEVASTQVGKETISTIQETWDEASKRELWSDPKILRVMTAQKESGLYDMISAEVDRQKILGKHQGVPFLEAYLNVGEELRKAGQYQPQASNGDTTTSDNPAPTPKRVLETKAKRKPAQNNDRVKAAAPSKTSPKKAPAQDFNPLAMSDEEFEKTSQLGSRY